MTPPHDPEPPSPVEITWALNRVMQGFRSQFGSEGDGRIEGDLNERISEILGDDPTELGNVNPKLVSNFLGALGVTMPVGDSKWHVISGLSVSEEKVQDAINLGTLDLPW